MGHSAGRGVRRADHLLVTSAKQLARVLRDGRFRGRAFSKAFTGKLLLSTHDRAPALIGTDGVLDLCEIDLPEAARARDWWRRFWDGHIMDFYATTDRLLTIVAAAKAATWRTLPELLMDEPKRTFRTLSEREFHKLVGAENSRLMILEAAMMGLSVRFLVEPANEEPAAPARQGRPTRRRGSGRHAG